MMQPGGQGEEIIRLPIASQEDIVRARQKVRDVAAEMGFSLLDQTRLVTAVSELARNIIVHAESGAMTVRKPGQRRGLKIVFEDEGPGIADLASAMQEGYSSAGSLGLGLQGAKRLTDAMEIDSQPGKGTAIAITKWL